MTADRARSLALELTAFPSVTDTDGESRFGPFLAELLRRSPAFAADPSLVRAERTVDDPRERWIVAALVRGGGDETLVLTGHYDVVSVDDFGPLEPWAFSPAELAPRLAAALRAEGARPGGGDEASAALDDLESGAFVPGRGLLDMKAGLAAGIAVLEDFAARPGRRGNLLFLAVPDEEGSSRGMRSALSILPRLCADWGVEPTAAINLDAAVDRGDGSRARVAFLGSVGKAHPFALMLGRRAHAGAPFDGVSAALLAAELVRRVECAPGLLGSGLGPEPPPPPAVLYCRDLRPGYDVTTPETMYLSVNVLTHDRGPEAILEAFAAEARAAMDAALETLRARAALQSRISGGDFAVSGREARVLRWTELEAAARAADPAAWEAARRDALAAGAAGAVDQADSLAGLLLAAIRIAGLEGPAAVIGLAPPWYPRAALDPVADARLLAAVRAGLEATPGTGTRPYFPGISDMSLLSPADPGEAGPASRECPLGLGMPDASFRCPTVNIGPWGREYHRRLERTEARYAFETLPSLLSAVVGAFFGAT